MVALAGSSGIALASASRDDTDLDAVTSADISVAHDDYYENESHETVTVLARKVAEGFLKFADEPEFYGENSPETFAFMKSAVAANVIEIRPRKDKIEAKATLTYPDGRVGHHQVVMLVSTAYQVTVGFQNYQENLQALFDSQSL